MKLNIGETIKRMRKEKEITQEEFSQVLGVSCQSVSRWENGSCYPDIELVPTIASFFDVSTDKLMGVDEITEMENVEKYLEKCRETLEDRFLQNHQVSQIIEDVQKAMRLFSDQTFSCPEIYDYIDTKAKEYARNVEQQLNQTKH